MRFEKPNRVTPPHKTYSISTIRNFPPGPSILSPVPTLAPTTSVSLPAVSRFPPWDLVVSLPLTVGMLLLRSRHCLCMPKGLRRKFFLARFPDLSVHLSHPWSPERCIHWLSLVDLSPRAGGTYFWARDDSVGQSSCCATIKT